MKGGFNLIDVYILNESADTWLVEFPTDSKTLRDLFEEMGTSSEYEIVNCELPDNLDFYSLFGADTSLEEINYLAAKLATLEKSDIVKLGACAEIEANCLADVINLTDNLDCFSFYSDIPSDVELGEYYVYDSGIYDTKNMGSLTNFIDCNAFGCAIRRDQNGQFVAGGYLVQEDNYPERYKSIADIPSEYRLFSYAGRENKKEISQAKQKNKNKLHER